MGEIAASVDERVYENQGNPALLALLPETPGRVLDCGCGAGDNARLLRERGWRVTGVTLSPGERERAAAWCESVHVADLEDGLPDGVDGPFDAILMSHVLEHLRRPERVLAAARDRLAPAGALAVALPNVLFYPIRLKALFGRFDYEPEGIMDETHVHFYTFRSGAELLRENGFAVRVATATGGMPLGPLRRALPGAWCAAFDRAAVARRPGLFGLQCLYVATPTGPERPTRPKACSEGS